MCVKIEVGRLALITGMQKPFIQKYVHVYSQEYVHIGKYPQLLAYVDRIMCHRRYYSEPAASDYYMFWKSYSGEGSGDIAVYNIGSLYLFIISVFYLVKYSVFLSKFCD